MTAQRFGSELILIKVDVTGPPGAAGFVTTTDVAGVEMLS